VTAGELAIVVATVLCCIGFAGLVVALMQVQRSLGELRVTVDDLRLETRQLLGELRTSVGEARASAQEAAAAVEEARDDLDRFDRVLGSAEAISGAVAGGSRVARAALSTPMIKTVAIASGTKEAGRRFWRRPDRDAGRRRRSRR
jgi:hypothetical protein